MTEPNQIEFDDAPSTRVRMGIVAGSALLFVVGAVAAMGASPGPSVTDGPASLGTAPALQVGTLGAPGPRSGFLGGMFGLGGFGRGGPHGVTISAINGSNLSLNTDDGWSRTITVGSSTTITKAGVTIAIGDLAVGDRIGFRQQKAADGTYTITAIGVVLPAIGGQVTAVSGNTISVTLRGGTTATIHVDGDTGYDVDGKAGKALADIKVGAFVIAVGTLRADGSLNADVVHSGSAGPRRLRDGHRPDRGFGLPAATPTPAGTATA